VSQSSHISDAYIPLTQPAQAGFVAARPPPGAVSTASQLAHNRNDTLQFPALPLTTPAISIILWMNESFI
jgi:hypothetical protein